MTSTTRCRTPDNAVRLEDLTSAERQRYAEMTTLHNELRDRVLSRLDVPIEDPGGVLHAVEWRQDLIRVSTTGTFTQGSGHSGSVWHMDSINSRSDTTAYKSHHYLKPDEAVRFAYRLLDLAGETELRHCAKCLTTAPVDEPEFVADWKRSADGALALFCGDCLEADAALREMCGK
jgi:hypothetical protein